MAFKFNIHPFHTLSAILTACFLFSACHTGNSSKASRQVVSTNPPMKPTPAFQSDSARRFTEAQTLFGPRVPNTSAHEACLNYLTQTFNRLGAQVSEQKANLTAFNGTLLHATNIIASYYPEKKYRLLLCAHWDSRPWADNDPDTVNHRSPVTGANDGASGVGVLLEIARLLSLSTPADTPAVGVDIVLFDAEDYGCPYFLKSVNQDEGWCLGSRYWAEREKTKPVKAQFGILLDMVGGSAPTFCWDYISMKYALNQLKMVWSQAASLGYGNLFLPKEGGAITDDHLYVNQLAGIPCLDIIDFNPDNSQGFPATWHTRHDTMDFIDASTLKAVGETVWHVIHSL
jgi:hypothetical protein